MAPILSTSLLFSAIVSLFATTYAAPTPVPQAGGESGPTGQLLLYTVDRPNINDTDGSGARAAAQTSKGYIPLSFQQPAGVGTDGLRILTPSDGNPQISAYFAGGYLRTELPIPRSDPPETATWWSINDNAFGSENAGAVGGQVNFTTTNQGADGGLQYDPDTGAFFLRHSEAEWDDWAIWTLCDQERPFYLAFVGSSSWGCRPVYLLSKSA